MTHHEARTGRGDIITHTRKRKGWLAAVRKDLRVARQAMPDDGMFDPENLPYRWTDLHLRKLAYIAVLLGLASGLFGVVILLESRFGRPYSRQADIPGEAWMGWIIAALLLYVGLWLSRHRDVIEIDRTAVTVRQRRLFGTRDWEEPLSAYLGMAMIRSESTLEDSTNVWTTWTVGLHHEDTRRSVILYSRMMDRDELVVSDHLSRITHEDTATCEQQALDLCKRWAKSMGIPMLAIRTDLPAGAPGAPPKDKQ